MCKKDSRLLCDDVKSGLREAYVVIFKNLVYKLLKAN